MTDEQQAPAQDADAPTMEPAAALEWLDTSTTEFFGAVEECARHIAAGVTEPNMTLETSARLNTFMLRLMEIAQQGQQQVRAAAPAPALEPEPEPKPEPEAVPGG
jgi:hypothetical protein